MSKENFLETFDDLGFGDITDKQHQGNYLNYIGHGSTYSSWTIPKAVSKKVENVLTLDVDYDWLEKGSELIDWQFDIVTKNLTKQAAQSICPGDRSCANIHVNNWISNGDVIMKVQWIRIKMTFFVKSSTNIKVIFQILPSKTFFERVVQERTIYANALYSYELSDNCTQSLWHYDF